MNTVPALPICGSLDCPDCVEKRRARIKARVRPSVVGEIAGVPRYAAGMEPPQRPWPWFSAKDPANEGSKTAENGGSDERAGQSVSARQRAWNRIAFQVAKRDKHRCQRCEKYLKYKHERSVHHIVPRDEHGGDHLDNLILLDHECHDWVEIQDPPLRSRAAIEGSFG